MNIQSYKKIINIIITVLLVAVIFLFSYANIFHFTAHMESDVASEALLAKEISLNNLRTPDTWYTSTETRVIFPANFAAFVYSMTKDLQTSMGIAATICGVLLTIAMIFCYKKIGLSKTATLSATLLPFVLSANIHDTLEMFILYAGYYFPVLIVFFITMYIYSILSKENLTPSAQKASQKSEQENQVVGTGILKQITAIAVSAAFSAILGAQGMRGVLMVYIPILSAHVLRLIVWKFKKRAISIRQILIAVWIFFLTALSALVCKITAPGVTSTSRNIRHGFEKLVNEVVPAISELYTQNSSPALTIIGVILSIFALIFSVYLLFIDNSFADANIWTTLAGLWAGFFVMIGAMAFTTFETAPRYGVCILFATGCGIGFFLDRVKSTIPTFITICAIILCTVLSFIDNTNNLILHDYSSSSPYYTIAEWMHENGTDIGYATFDFANDMTVTCNGSVNIYAVNSIKEMEGCKWLSNATWYPPYESSDRQVCIITTDATDQDFKTYISEHNLSFTKSTGIGQFYCYILEQDPIRWVD